MSENRDTGHRFVPMRRVIMVALLVVSCSPTDEAATPTSSTSPPPTTTTTAPPTTTTEARAAFELSSPAFEDGAPIPGDYTCDGADVSPELSVVGIPTGAESIVLIADDPDAPLGTWDHWVEFDIPADAGRLDIERDTGALGVQGVNSWNLSGYGGPCPPGGESHEYSFTVYALDSILGLPAGVESGPVYSAMAGHVLGSVVLTGTYAR